MKKDRVYTEIVILCEDRQQEIFAKAFIQAYYKRRVRKIRVCIMSQGKGSGEQNVRKNYLVEVKKHRQLRNMNTIALVVMIDADTKKVKDRLRQLDKILTDDTLDPRLSDERIAIFVPRRNIETWISFLEGNPVTETKRYPDYEDKTVSVNHESCPHP